jgi:hypothetical protein
MTGPLPLAMAIRIPSEKSLNHLHLEATTWEVISKNKNTALQSVKEGNKFFLAHFWVLQMLKSLYQALTSIESCPNNQKSVVKFTDVYLLNWT